MSTPLELAVDIVGTLARARGAGAPLDITVIAADMSRRHSGTGYSQRDIADALAEEGAHVGMPVVRRSLREI